MSDDAHVDPGADETVKFNGEALSPPNKSLTVNVQSKISRHEHRLSRKYSSNIPDAKSPQNNNKSKSQPWLHAWYDPLANLSVIDSACLCFADLASDGESKLLIVHDTERRIRIFTNTSLLTEIALLGDPMAVVSFYADQSLPCIPSIAVASGEFVYIYKNLRPFFKFTLPRKEPHPLEFEAWKASIEIQDQNARTVSLVEKLAALRMEKVELNSNSMCLLAIESIEEQVAYIRNTLTTSTFESGMTASAPNAVTTMSSIKNSTDDPRAVSSIVIGTEHGQILILNTSGTSISTKINLPAAPVCMDCNGLLSVEYRIVVACRNGNIYTVKNGKLLGTVIEMETPISNLCIVGKNVIISCMNDTIYGCTAKGTGQFQVHIPEGISSMTRFELKRILNVSGYLVATKNAQVRLYVGKLLISSFETESPVIALRFGPYGREDACLALVSKNGGLTIKILQRQADLSAQDENSIPLEQDVPLNIPKRTQLYIDQTSRELSNAPSMHRVFQRDLIKIRLNAARTFVKVISDGQSNMTSASASVQLAATVRGLGPHFKLHVGLRNTGTSNLTNVPVSIVFNPKYYQVAHPCIVIPLLLQNVSFKHSIDVISVDAEGNADEIRVFVGNPTSPVPLVTAIVKMRRSEVLKIA